MKKVSKSEILKEVIKSLSLDIESIGESLASTNKAIDNAPSAMESHSDTTRSQLTAVVGAINQSFLEKSKGIETLKHLFKSNIDEEKFDEVKYGSIVILEKNGGIVENFFVLSAGSGIKVENDGEKITCLTVSSPLGKILLGKEKGQSFNCVIGGKSQDFKILDIL